MDNSVAFIIRGSLINSGRYGWHRIGKIKVELKLVTFKIFYHALRDSGHTTHRMGTWILCFWRGSDNTYFARGRYYCDLAKIDQGRQGRLIITA
jgi:hypothetical protein